MKHLFAFLCGVFLTSIGFISGVMTAQDGPRPRPQADPGGPLPPFVAQPPGWTQTSWPQVDYTKPESIGAFVDAHRYGGLLINKAAPVKPKRTYAGWIGVGSVAVDDLGRQHLKVLGDRAFDARDKPNPDHKMPDDAGWDWWLTIDSLRVTRMKSDTPMTPVRFAELTVRVD